ncbi:MAG: nucleoside deaminase [Acidimicrobiia bacterium]
MRTYDLNYLRQAIAVAADARRSGNHPFGAVLVDADGRLLLQAENTVNTAHDCTGHAETNLIRKASAQFSPQVLAGCTLYTSTEPCAMCSGAIYWAGIPRVVYGLPETALAAMTGDDPNNPTLVLSSELVLNSGTRKVEVVGPLLAEEAAKVHAGFWRAEV